MLVQSAMMIAASDEDLAKAREVFNRAAAEAGATTVWDKSLIITLVICLLLFSLIVFWLMYLLIKQDRPVSQVLRAFGTILVIVAAVLLQLVGFGEKQVAPVVGLLGTVVGYLLGRTHSAVDESAAKASGASNVPADTPKQLPPSSQSS